MFRTRWAMPTCAAIVMTTAGWSFAAEPQESFLIERAQSLEPKYLQVVNPADKQRELSGSDDKLTGRVEPTNPFADRKPSYDMPAVEVEGERAPVLFEEDRVGPYKQPRWTARRRFPTTRVYVRPPGAVEFEYWLRPTVEDDGTSIRSLYEISMGFEPRLQLDLYLRTDSDDNESETLLGQQVELRYALADWGRIWGNPTLYFEWVGLEQRPDKFEVKLLLGDELAPRWHWGINLVGEFETGGEREYEYQVTGGLSYSVIDYRFAVGAEVQWLFADVKEDRGDFDHTIFLGPSFQYRPLPQMRIDFAPMVGITSDDPDFRAYLVVGWEF